MAKKVAVLFVCLGNICRSPTAHGVFRQLVLNQGLNERIQIDSAGTAAYHVGKAPDSRSTLVAKERGIDMSDLRARKVDFGDFIEYDYILAMDEANFNHLKAMALPEHYSKIKLFLDYSQEFEEREVPDPYYGGATGFDHVFDLVESASKGLLAHIKQQNL
ncbi:low molecular weight protein-tyrosine-phosphatase [Thiomicrorhabdus aquaedulcis]|uniref:low molecular weight protein-tyrosine-phosphatase n=1 Tax=Thiomicrorhabdus aquaedulcis TaxID=2211106 RepID=UPI000FDB4922|nr:low molecular weight protein-tyrosine-phosphatase [Thiomicrorhabdus aquaedulcis]